MDGDALKMADYILAVSFAASSVTIVSGAMAERCKLPAYFFFSACMGGIIYPLAAHWCAPFPPGSPEQQRIALNVILFRIFSMFNPENGWQMYDLLLVVRIACLGKWPTVSACFPPPSLVFVF